MITNILRDAETTKKLLEAILDSSNGKRSLSRLARVCHALCEPALDVLWRELDSIVPILGLFPASVLKKARRPGLGFVSSRMRPLFTIHSCVDTRSRPRHEFHKNRIGIPFSSITSGSAVLSTMRRRTTSPLPFSLSSTSTAHASIFFRTFKS
jgi:hypothetical protein